MRILALGLLACFYGCAAGGGTSPESHLYMLRTTTAPTSFNSVIIVGLDTVQVSGYLKRPELVLQVGTQEFRPARYHRWAEPLQQSVRRYLRDRLSAELRMDVDANDRLRDRWDVRVSVMIEEFHGTLDGQASLIASWHLERAPDQTSLRRGRAQLTEAQRRDGYAALVDAQGRLLDSLAKRIAVDLDSALTEED